MFKTQYHWVCKHSGRAFQLTDNHSISLMHECGGGSAPGPRCSLLGIAYQLFEGQEGGGGGLTASAPGGPSPWSLARDSWETLGLARTPQQDGASRAGAVLIQSEASGFSLAHLRALGLCVQILPWTARDRCGGCWPLWTVDQQKWKEGDHIGGFCSSLGKKLELETGVGWQWR